MVSEVESAVPKVGKGGALKREERKMRDIFNCRKCWNSKFEVYEHGVKCLKCEMFYSFKTVKESFEASTPEPKQKPHTKKERDNGT